MSASKHRTLAAKAAYLRLASSDGGLGINRKWMPHMTKLLQRLIDDKLVALRRSGPPRSATTTVHATEAGREALAAIEVRYGAGFGTRASIDAIEPPRPRKEVRRARAAEPETRHAFRQRMTRRRLLVDEQLARFAARQD